MAEAQINSNVGVNVNATGMAKAAGDVEAKIRGIVKAIEQAGTAANDQLKALAIGMKQLDTLRTTNARLAGGDFNSAQGLGRQARALAEYRAGISKTSDAVGVLRGRMVALDVANGKLLQSGRVPTKGSILNAQNIEQTASSYGKLTNQVAGLRGRIALLGDDSRKAFAPMLAQLDKVDAKNAKLFGQNNRFNFKPQLDQMNRLVGSLGQQVSVSEKNERVQRQTLETLREQGRQLLANNEYERLSQRAASVRQGQTILRNADLTGTDVSRRATALQRMASTSQYALLAERQLNTELVKPAAQQNAERIQTLINRLQVLRRELGLATAEQIRNNNEQQKGAGKGGFFSGLKSVGKGLFDNPEGSGSAFGAGALVGRVGMYAAVATAVYNLIGAIKEGIQFSIQFEDALAQLQAISGSTTLEMDRLSAGILAVSKTSATSVLDLTKAATIIAQAGYGGEEITQMLDSVTKLADASGSTASDAVDILTSSLGSFQLAAGESERVTDALVGALNSSKLGVSQVQQGIQYLGATAKEQNISLNELVAMLGVMADAGVRGTTAATGLRQMFIEMIDPSKKMVTELEKIGLTTADIDVKTLGAVEVLQRLRDHGFEAYSAVETRAAAAYVAISSNIPAIGQLEAATTRAGAAAQAQEARVASTAARWQIMLNTWAEAAAQIGRDLGPALRGLIAILEGVGQAILLPIQGVSLLIGAISDLIVGTDTLKFSQSDFKEALLDTGLGLDEVADLTDSLGDSFEDLDTLSNDLASRYTELETKQGSLREETGKLILRQDILGQSTSSVANEVNILASRFPGLREEFSKTQGGIQGLITAMFNLDIQAQRTMASVAAAQIVTAQAKIDDANARATRIRNAPTPRVASNTRSPYTLSGQRAGEADPALAKFDAARRRGDWDVALDIAAGNANVRKFRQEQYGEIASFRQDYEINSNIKRNSTANRDMARLFTSPNGARVSQAVQRVVGEAGYAASTGKDTADYLSRIDSQLKTLDEISKNPGMSDGALAGIGQLQALLTGARSQLLPEPEKAEGSGRSKRTPRGGGDRAQRDFYRVEADIAKEEAEWKKKLYENSVEALNEAPTLDELPALMADVNTSLKDWLEAENKVSLAEIERSKPNPEQRQRLLAAAAEKANQLRVEAIDNVADTLGKAIKKFIDETTKAIERQFALATRGAERTATIAKGRVEGLNNPLVAANVPEYFRTIMQRRADEADDVARRTTIGANDRRLAEYQAALAKIKEERDQLNIELARLAQNGESDGVDANGSIVVNGQKINPQDRLREIGQEVTDLEDKTYELETANGALKASYDVLKDVPTTFEGGLKAAVEALRIETGGATSFAQNLINNLDQPLRALNEGFQSFFTDMLTGSATVGQAFGNLAKTVIQAIEQMVAVALAKKFFSLILGAIFPAGPVASLGGDAESLISANPGIFWKGGQIKMGGSGTMTARRMYGGGNIMSGLGTRDSTLIHAARDEYLIRRPAAQSLGKGFLDAINARGAGALSGMRRPIMPVMPQAKQETNVYVVKPDQQPTLGPKDVLVILQDDVLQGGATKRLIKSVSQGTM